MSKAPASTTQDPHYKAEALSHLAEARRIIRRLAAERRRAQRRRARQTSILSEIKIIPHGA